MAGHPAKRATAALIGAAVLLLALWTSLFALLFVGFVAQAPDAFAPDGDPCCGTPDTWSQIFTETIAAAVAVVAVALLFALAFGLLVWARRSRWPGRRTLAAFPAVALGLLALALAVAWATDDARLRASCDGFGFQRADWRSRSVGVQLRTADAVARCGVLGGQSAIQVARQLGQPTTKGPVSGEQGADSLWSYAHFGVDRADATSPQDLSIYFRRGRVSFARFTIGCC